MRIPSPRWLESELRDGSDIASVSFCLGEHGGQMKRGEHITLEIDRLNAKGDGVGICDGREVVVPRAVPGDRALVYLRRKRKGRFEGVIDDLIEPGVERVDPQCVHFGVCGGCRWQDIAYEDQLQIKETLVRRLVAERDLPVALWRPILPSPVQDFYRNKMEFSFGSSQDGTPQLGLHMRGRYNRVFDLETCWLQSEISNRIVDSVRTHATQLGLPVYDLRSHEGLLRFLVVRDAKRTGQVMVNLVVARYPDDGVDALLEAVLADLHEEITTCIVTLHSGKAQVALGEEEFHVRGDGHMWERCGEMEYAISARSFFQTNTLAAERLYETVCELAGDLVESDVLDLYAGTGGMSLHLARLARSVTGVESVSEAVDDARRNAERNGITNCRFVGALAEDLLADAVGEPLRYDLVVVDPPRAGLHKKAKRGILDLGPGRLLYVSCNADTLAEDLRDFVDGGYEILVAQPVDLFPHTPHCEIVVSLRRTQDWNPHSTD